MDDDWFTEDELEDLDRRGDVVAQCWYRRCLKCNRVVVSFIKKKQYARASIIKESECNPSCCKSLPIIKGYYDRSTKTPFRNKLTAIKHREYSRMVFDVLTVYTKDKP